MPFSILNLFEDNYLQTHFCYINQREYYSNKTTADSIFNITRFLEIRLKNKSHIKNYKRHNLMRMEEGDIQSGW